MAVINPNQFGRIGVLMGGPSTEREVSLKSGKAVKDALQQINMEVVAIDIKTDNVEENIRLIKSHHIDCAFIALHGRFGEDGQIQEMLDKLEIPYTGSSSLASKLAMDKIASRRIFEAGGIAVPKYKVLNKPRTLVKVRGKSRTKALVRNNFNSPFVVKPATHGSSIGLSIVDKREDLDKAVDLAFTFDEKIIIEEYIRGREITVGILDEVALPVIEIVPKKRFFDYEAKYQTGMTEYIVPAKLEENCAKKIQGIALSAHKLLGCFGCSRVDMILNTENIPFCLEINSIPGLTPTSLLPKAAKTAGIAFEELCFKLIQLAYEKARDKFIFSPEKSAGFTP